MNRWVLLLLAVAFEVTGTTALKLSDGFRRLPWGTVTFVGYGAAFVALAHTLKNMPIGVAYAVWSGLGAVGAVVVGLFFFREPLTLPKMFGLVLVLAGVITLYSSEQSDP